MANFTEWFKEVREWWDANNLHQYREDPPEEALWYAFNSIGQFMEMMDGIERCPNINCGDSGSYPDYDSMGNVVQVQCEFCWTNENSVFNRIVNKED